MKVNHAIRTLDSARQPKRAGKLQLPTIGDGEIMAFGLDSLVPKSGGAKFVFSIGSPRRPYDVLPGQFVVLLQG